MTTQLTPNFTLEELTRSSVALRHGIDNTPDKEEESNLKLLAQHILQPVRDHFGTAFGPSSGYRCIKLNILLGSKGWSQHIDGHAVDFEVPGVPNRDLAEWIKANLDFDQLILEFHNPDIPDSGWIHCSYVGIDDNRNECLIFDGTKFSKF